MSELLQRLRYSPLRPWYDRFNVLRWRVRGRPIPPPYGLKRRVILEHARRFGIDVLVETGTFHGETMYFAKSRFRKAYSIELDEALFQENQARFRGVPNVELIQGDSGVELPRLAARLKERALFWLDGHYCGPGTGMGEQEAPVYQEMECIVGHPVRDHVILIDDARLFEGKAGYPAIPEFRRWVAERRPDLTFCVEDDIIRITPALG